MTGGAWDEKPSAEAWQGAFGRTHTRVGHHFNSWVRWMCVHLQPTLTFVALRMTRRASSVKQQAQPARSTQSKLGQSECGLVAGNGPAKSQVMPSTCSRAAAADGSDIQPRRRRSENVCVKRLSPSTFQIRTWLPTSSSSTCHTHAGVGTCGICSTSMVISLLLEYVCSDQVVVQQPHERGPLQRNGGGVFVTRGVMSTNGDGRRQRHSIPGERD